ncbi:MAG: ribonuclease E inhibitor RraB [Rhodocyclaceae bacterium]|nr:ribonuclease E inhibitor RraB [Rhodocyclaceae bacterium]
MTIVDIPDDETGQAIRRWVAEGSDLSKAMEIDFFIDVADEITGLRLTSDPALAGFSISVEKDDPTGRWTCYCTITMIPDYDAIVGMEAILTATSERFGAIYEGFGSFGNAER